MRKRTNELQDVIKPMTGWLTDMQKLDSSTLMSLTKMGAQVQKLLEVKNSISGKFKGQVTRKKLAGLPDAFLATSPSAVTTGASQDQPIEPLDRRS